MQAVFLVAFVFSGLIIATGVMLIATFACVSRASRTVMSLIAFAALLLQAGCWKGLGDIGRATGGASGTHPIYGAIGVFAFFITWSVILIGLSRTKGAVHKETPVDASLRPKKTGSEFVARNRKIYTDDV